MKENIANNEINWMKKIADKSFQFQEILVNLTWKLIWQYKEP